MTTEERARFEVLLENIQRSVQVIAEGVAIVDRLDRIDLRLERVENRVDSLERTIDVFEKSVNARFKGVETRLERIEHHVGLNGRPSVEPKRKPASKRRSR